MDKIKIKLQDLSFYNDASSSKYQPNFSFEWDRSPGFGPVVFFTDLCLPYVELSCYKTSFKIAWIIEPIVINQFPYQYIVKNHDKFDMVITHHVDLLKINPNKFRYYYFGGTWIPQKDRQIYVNKPKNISLIASAKANTEGQRLRHEIANLFNNKIDLFGYGYKSLENKSDALREYAFSIAIENCRVPVYATEKLNDIILTGGIPVYWGPNKEMLKPFFNTDGIIFFNNIDEIDQIIKDIERDGQQIYDNLTPVIQENYERVQKLICAENFIYTEILRPSNLV